MGFLKTYLDPMVFGTLGVMSFLSIWFAIERLQYYRRVELHDYDHADELNVYLTRNLTVIYSIGANAPYVGLLGTVLGILITFYDLGQGGDIEPAAIMLGLALALKATAGGLLVAIPAILAYNALLRKVEVLTAKWGKQQSQQSV
ncbi:MAG: TonB-system energizer ExbB [Gammaproteobacteria bacterium]|nr:TonB-system energizer ExbB [Gammaproteobacteria bacterium]